jgi:IclR family transcriptional regulator, blcABC operon repressor
MTDPTITDPGLRDVASSAPAVTRAIALLSVLAEPDGEPMGPSDLARRLGLPKSSVANLCAALESSGMLLRVGEGRYRLGHRVLELGSAYLRKVDLLEDFREGCRGLGVASSETIQLALLDNLEVLYLARHDGSQPIRLAADIGRRMPATCTGLGKAMLAQLEPAIVEDRLRQLPMLPRLSPNSITSIPALLAELAVTRERGFAIDEQENTVGVVCFAVPLPVVTGAPPRAVSVTLLKARETRELRDALVDDLKRLVAYLPVRV